MPSPVGVSILPIPAEVLPISFSVYSFKPIQKHQHERRSDISGTQFDMHNTYVTMTCVVLGEGNLQLAWTRPCLSITHPSSSSPPPVLPT